MPPPVRFLTAPDGVRLAYCAHGEGPPLVYVRGWLSHLDMLWDDPAFRAYFEALARCFRVVRFDARGNGLSDRSVPPITLDALASDLETIVDGLGLEAPVLYASTYGGLIAMTYVARHPDRVSRLILDGTYARGAELTSTERREWILSMLRDSPDVALQRVLSYFTHPEPEVAVFRRAPARDVIDAEVAVQLYRIAFEADLIDLLPSITVPALVMHRRKSLAVPFRLGRELASRLADARFVPLEGSAHNSWEGDAQEALDAVGSFLGVPLEVERPPEARASGGLVTILFTDIESSSALRRSLGDERAHELVRTHNTIVRDALAVSGGSEIKHTGDGIMASFGSALRALECAVAIQRGVASHLEAHPDAPLRVYVGLNAGEPIAEERDLFGTSVDLARRLVDEARPGEILVSNVVRELAAGKGFRFVERGEAMLKGFDEPVRLYAVDWAAGP